MSTNCDTCINKHDVPQLAGGGMECRANPPQAFLVPQQGGGITRVSVFPPVNNEMSCSLYEADFTNESDNGKDNENAIEH